MEMVKSGRDSLRRDDLKLGVEDVSEEVCGMGHRTK